MKKTIALIFIVLSALVGGYIFFLGYGDQRAEESENQSTRFSSSQYGFEFSYPAGPDGYVMSDQTPPAGEGELLRTFVLMQTKDANNPPPEGGEGAPTITISVFKNSKKQQSGAWAQSHIQYSNINLKIGEVQNTVVGGANAVRYMADGLYASANVVVAHGENVYVLTGMYLDADSKLRKDFSPIVDSIQFIPQPGQE